MPSTKVISIHNTTRLVPTPLSPTAIAAYLEQLKKHVGGTPLPTPAQAAPQIQTITRVVLAQVDDQGRITSRRTLISSGDSSTTTMSPSLNETVAKALADVERHVGTTPTPQKLAG
jgi:hypothetical protein